MGTGRTVRKRGRKIKMGKRDGIKLLGEEEEGTKTEKKTMKGMKLR